MYSEIMGSITVSRETKPDVGKNHGAGGNMITLIDVVVGSCMNEP